MINTSAFGSITTVKALASKPVVVPARLTGLTVGIVVAGLAGNVFAGEDTSFKAGLCGGFLGKGGGVSRTEEGRNNGGVVAEAVGEHAAVVAVVVHAGGVSRVLHLGEEEKERHTTTERQ